ncbi:MAG TPA: WD40 repeat domain-containing protein [Gemmataceae bacterium]|nr:WD40 repeat domain-containing protein [Gemmataceae bacterium]
MKTKVVLVLLALGLEVSGAGLAAPNLGVGFASRETQIAQSAGVTGKTGGQGKKAATGATDSFGDPLPAGSALRFGTIRYRHGTRIESLAVSADGKVAAAWGDHLFADADIRIFDLTNGRVRTTFPRTAYGPYAVALSPDGRTLATKVGQAIHLHDAATGKELRKIEPGKALINKCLFSPDSKALALASGSNGKAIYLLDVDKGTVVRTFAHDGVVYAYAFSPDGKLLAAEGHEKNNSYVRILEVATGKLLRRIATGPDDLHTLAFSPDGKTLATGGRSARDARLRLWDVGSGKVQHVFAQYGYPVRSVAFTPDGKTVAAAGDAIRFYDSASGKELRQIGRHALGLSFSSDGKTLTGAVSGVIYRWDMATGKSLNLEMAGDSGVDQVLASGDGRHVVTSSEDGDAHLWDAKTAKHIRFFEATWAAGIALSPDGKFVAWPVEDKSIKFEDPVRRGSTATGRRLRLYDVASDQFIDRFPSFKGDANDLAFTPDGKTLIAVDHGDNQVRLWDVVSGKEVRAFNAGPADEKMKLRFMRRAVLSPDGRTLAVISKLNAGSLYVVRLWDVATGKERHELPGYKYSVDSVAFSPDSRLIATAGRLVGPGGFRPQDSNRLYVYEVASGRQLTVLRDGLPIGEATCTAFSQDGRTMATSGPDGTIKLWEVATWKVRAEFRGHRNGVTALTFAPHGQLLSGGLDTTVLAWDLWALREPLPVNGKANGD